ncbi:hypothetical protein KY290_014330 [Solanum tuberosum]|uniref:Uncharacterized protein n=1 Tax=Solanum tuberosum TaxID=4113 RepID=A0ABQ7VPC5_SOLTU|nr:hypothetical protein KY289_014389 [Solanum tuberosum]KAH0699515.1 hypothetical protein KY284_013730 [Solanum tuberosum]KAH0770349.1 hypothetical protein KY290_014330 [Solanum tuberosum]
MPSGAKKRKAAKKKKQVQAIEPPSRSTGSFPGEEDLKRDDKESDSEGSSPASQDYQNHQNQFTEGEVEDGEKQLDDSHDRSIEENEFNGVKHEGKEVEIVGNEEGGLVQVERELKVECESESQKISVENSETMIESNRGGLQRSSSSSSSSCSSSVEKYDVADKNDVVVDDAPTVELVKDIESLSGTNNIVVDDAPVVELVKDIESLLDKNSIVVDDAPAVELVKDNESLPDEQVADILVETTSACDLDKAAISEDIVQVTTSASDADNVIASAVELVVKEKGEENLCVVDEKDTASDTVVENWKENLGAIVDKATISEVLMETVSEKRDETATAASCDVSAISSGNTLENTDAKASATLENEEKIEAPHSTPKIDASVSADVKESPARECHDHQLTALPSRPVQTTSWKSCCGLFELFAGSNR